MKLSSCYPSLDLCESIWLVGPASINPIISDTPVYPWNLGHIYPSVTMGEDGTHEQQDLSEYPYNLQNIYPARSRPAEIDVRLRASYPCLDICTCLPAYRQTVECVLR